MDQVQQDICTEFEEIEKVQRHLGVAISQLSGTLKNFESVYTNISKIHSIKRQLFVDLEMLKEERDQLQKERIKLRKEKEALSIMKRSLEGAQIEQTADSLLTVLKKDQQISASSSELSDSESTASNLSSNTYSQVATQTAIQFFNNASQTLKKLM
eukprot:NODE_17_length_48642_cov_1.199349.p36 type:complete len:156 gc:universal NODE_17_length_48642_cov_1.199349:45099-45566(+)